MKPENATRLQMKMVLTRLGEGAAWWSPDPTQVDLPRLSDIRPGHAGGFWRTKGRYRPFPPPENVVRHPCWSAIVKAYAPTAARERAAA